jgi:hypothetical protein
MKPEQLEIERLRREAVITKRKVRQLPNPGSEFHFIDATRPQGVARKGARVEKRLAGIGLDDVGNRAVGQAVFRYGAGFVYAPEDRASLNAGRVQPFAQGLGRAGDIAAGNGDGDAVAFLVGLAALIVTKSPFLPSAMSATSRATSSERRNAPAKAEQ